MVRVHRATFAAIAAAGVLVGSLAGCGRSGAGDQDGGPEPAQLVFKVATTDSVTSLDPAGPSRSGSRSLQANLYQTLLTILPGKPTPVPEAADCQYDAPTTYTCSLKTGLTFPNEHKLTASDVKFSFDRLLRIKAPGGPAPLFGSLASVTTPDDLTVVFTLKRPDARLPYLLSTTAGSIVDEEVYPAAKLLPGQGIGSGPYKLTEYKQGQRAVLAKFLKYRGVRAAQNDRIEVSTVDSSAAVVRAVTGGKADLGVSDFSAADLPQVPAGDDKVQVVGADAAEIRYLAFSGRTATARKPAVRRAVAQLLDRPALVKRAYADQVTPLYSLVPPGFSGHVDAFKTAYAEPDKAAAAAILRDARITAPVNLTLGWTPTQYGPGAKAEVQEVKRQLEASGLFKVTLRSAEWPRFRQLARSGGFDLYHAGWVPAVPDSDDYLAPFLRDGAPFQNGYKSAPAARLRDSEVTSQNQIDREATLAELQELLAREAPVIPTWQGRITAVAAPAVQHVEDALSPFSVVYYSPLRK